MNAAALDIATRRHPDLIREARGHYSRRTDELSIVFRHVDAPTWHASVVGEYRRIVRELARTEAR